MALLAEGRDPAMGRLLRQAPVCRAIDRMDDARQEIACVRDRASGEWPRRGAPLEEHVAALIDAYGTAYPT